MRAGYPDDAPGVVLGSPMLGGEVLTEVPGPSTPVHDETGTVSRRSHGHGEDEDAASHRGTALGRPGSRCSVRT
jgi:hypothetical protein